MPDSIPFTEPMECLPVKKLPNSRAWGYEIKLDGYRAQAIHDKDGFRLLSRTGKELTAQAPQVSLDLRRLMPIGTAIDGELCALDDSGRPNFQLMQNRKSSSAPLVFYAFDVLYIGGHSRLHLTLAERRGQLKRLIGKGTETVHLSADFQAPLTDILATVRQHGLEGIVAKRNIDQYEPGTRSGSWVKYRITSAQEFVIGGYTKNTYGVDALLLGFYRKGKLIFCSSCRNGFVPASRRSVFATLQPLVNDRMPFANLPEKGIGRWGEGMTAGKMKNCVWVRPEAVAQIEFLEWTDGNHLRHASFVGLREDKDPRSVVREEAV